MSISVPYNIVTLDNRKSDNTIKQNLNNKHHKYACYKWTGFSIIITLGVVSGIAHGFDRHHRLMDDNEQNMICLYTLIACDILDMAFFIFTIYLMLSSVYLLRRFVIDQKTHHSNERTALLHLIMIISLFIANTSVNIS